MTRYDDEEVAALGARAAALTRHAYAPYSGFHVAALALADGKTFEGVNMENASYGLALCAEVAALTAAATAGRFGGVEAMVVIGGRLGEDGRLAGKDPVLPCGRCRQLIFETAALQGRDIPIFAFSGDLARVERTSIGALLPSAFGPGNLD